MIEPVPRRRRPTFHEWLTTLIALAALGVSFASWRTAANTTELRQAIASLTDLAGQTKRQADGVTGQLSILQAQVTEARKQTVAISEQTTAIKIGAEANVRSATAQQRAADISASATRAAVTLSELTLRSFKAEPVDGRVPLSVRPQFRNVGGSAISVQGSVFVLALVSELPPQPRLQDGVAFGGANELVATPGSVFGPSEAVEVTTNVATAKGILDKTLRVFLYGVVNYTDATGADGRWCFAYEVDVRDGEARYFRPTGSAAYRCGAASQ